MTRLLVVVCAALFGKQASAQNSIELLHHERLLEVGGALAATAKPTLAQDREWAFEAFGRRFDLTLEPNPKLAAIARKAGLGTQAWRGTLRGEAGSWARIVTSPRGDSGLLFDGATLYGIESPDDSLAPAAPATVVFRLNDVYVPPGTLGCSSAPADGEQAVALMLEELTPRAAQGAALNLDMGAVADFEFSQALGTDAETALLIRLNNVDGIFTEQLGIQISVAETDVFTADDDPFTESDSELLLEELAIYRGATPSQEAQGLTHMFTGRNLEGTTVGIAYIGALCSRVSPFDPLKRSFGVGLSEGLHGSVIDSLIAAHEIGHNFGAPHDGEAGSACETTPETFLMAPSINGNDQFSACSIDEMQAEIAAADCLTLVADPDVSVASDAGNLSVLTGTTFEYPLRILNSGVEDATGVRLDVNVDPNLNIIAAEVDLEPCAMAGDSAVCDIGVLPPGASVEARLTLRGQTTGDLVLAAGVVADEDSDPANDQYTATITVEPRVDLTLSGNSVALLLDEAIDLEVSIDNVSAFSATRLAVSLEVGTALRIDAATLDGGSCSATTTTASCALQVLDAQSTTHLRVGLTGLETGQAQVRIFAAAFEAEQNSVDNTLTLLLDVGAPPPPPEEPQQQSSGSGSVSILWWLPLLGALRGRRRRMTRDRVD